MKFEPDMFDFHRVLSARVSRSSEVRWTSSTTPATASTKWEQSAAYVLDTHARVEAFAKNAGLGFAMPYLHNGQTHDYVQDFIVRLRPDPPRHLVLETKGFDPLEEVKVATARRWVAAVNADGSYGSWAYAIVQRVADIDAVLIQAAGQSP
jgi:type III restriction enzyme